MVSRSWDKIPKDLIIKSFRVCGQVKDLNLDEIVCFRKGRCAADGKPLLEDLLKLSPDDIDYHSLKKKTETTIAVNLEETFEENLDESWYESESDMDFMDDPLDQFSF